MVRTIRKAAVLGAGTMGARIAAHLANANVPVVLLDVVPAELSIIEKSKGLSLSDRAVRNRLARSGLDAALQSRPAAFFVPEAARLITIGNFADDLPILKDCDWIIEAVAEDRAIKRALFEKVESFRAPEAIVSTNTSGLSIRALAEGFSEGFRRHFLGTHFFNPPRYLKLLELIPTAETMPEVVTAISRFADVGLGKGIVLAKDTPNFIGNRIGILVPILALRFAERRVYSLEELDALTGPAIGFPKSATFRTLDIVGLDVLAHVVTHLHETLTEDEQRDIFKLPEFVQEMIGRNLLGEKTGQGFYKKVPGEILTLDLSTFEYRERIRPKCPALDAVKPIEDLPRRVRALFDSPGREGAFYRSVLSATFHYAASRIPEISDDLLALDRAMKWGFGWELGPFELWDAVGLDRVLDEWTKEKLRIPPLVEKLSASGSTTFYAQPHDERMIFDLASSAYRQIPDTPGLITLSSLHARAKEMKRNAGASLVDLDHGVLALEFHSKMNTIGADAVEMIHAGLKRLNDDFDAMVIGNQGANFSAGANLMLVLMAAQEEDWDELDRAVRAFQNANIALKYAPKPIVAAPHGLTLGGGAEIAIHTARVHAAAETYMGLVETGVGLIPAGGGTKEMLVRAMDRAPNNLEEDPFTPVQEVFLNIGTAKVSTSAEEARRLGYLLPRDFFSMNRDRQIADAKQVALELACLDRRPGPPQMDIRVLGQAAFAKMKLGLHLMRRAEHISEYDVIVGTHLAKILSGGGKFTSPQLVSEQYLLDLERESFLSLCGQKKTQERMQFMLKHGKPLRN